MVFLLVWWYYFLVCLKTHVLLICEIFHAVRYWVLCILKTCYCIFSILVVIIYSVVYEPLYCDLYWILMIHWEQLEYSVIFLSIIEFISVFTIVKFYDVGINNRTNLGQFRIFWGTPVMAHLRTCIPAIPWKEKIYLIFPHIIRDFCWIWDVLCFGNHLSFEVWA